jgi:hypothetical protein
MTFIVSSGETLFSDLEKFSLVFGALNEAKSQKEQEGFINYDKLN